MSEKRLQEYMNSFSMFSAAVVDFQKEEKKAITKKPFQNPSWRAVSAVTLSAEKYWGHIHCSDS